MGTTVGGVAGETISTQWNWITSGPKAQADRVDTIREPEMTLQDFEKKHNDDIKAAWEEAARRPIFALGLVPCAITTEYVSGGILHRFETLTSGLPDQATWMRKHLKNLNDPVMGWFVKSPPDIS